MAYDRKKVYNQAIEAIKKNNLFFVEDIVAFIPINKKTIYEWWPLESNESNSLKELLEQNKIKTKSDIREKLYKGTKASELIALYKLICTDEERRALQLTYTENTHTIEDKRKSIDQLFPPEEELFKNSENR